MDAVDRIRELCLSRGISISRLERECGFSNGYIRGMKDGKMSAERLKKTADYLHVPYDYLLTGDLPIEYGGYYTDPETAEIAQELFANRDLRLLFDASRNATPEQLKLIRDLVLQMTKDNQE